MAVRPEKRAAILAAGRTTFGRLGYTRASIDAIAAAAEVSTRTIYKHFASKEELFATVLEASATEVADTFVQRVREGVGAARSTEAKVLAIARAMAAQHLEHPEHFAMVRQIMSERDHFPEGAVTAWAQAGPNRVEREVRAQLLALRDAGELAFADEGRAATHLFALALAELNGRRLDGPARLTAEAADESVVAGAAAFQRAYAA
jgi:AcrR family transcriptional regulator